MNLKNYIRSIPDYPKKGILFRDITTLIKDEKNLNDPLGWSELRESIKNSYTMSAEHMMYKAIMNGTSIQEALNIYKDKMNQLDNSEDIELF